MVREVEPSVGRFRERCELDRAARRRNGRLEELERQRLARGGRRLDGDCRADWQE